MHQEKLKIKRNILLKSFVIGYLLIIFSVAMFYFFSDFMFNLMQCIYRLDQLQSAIIIAQATIFMKIAVFTLFLVPALALQWEIVSSKEKEEHKEG